MPPDYLAAMSIEIPDTLGEEDRGDDSKPSLRALLTAVVSVLVVSFIVGAQSGQSAEEASTTLAEETTTSVPRLNDPLNWQADKLGETFPQGLLGFEGSLYFFGTPGFASPFEVGKGLDAWVLVDGVTWKSLGTVIEPPNQIHTVAATPRGLVAAGSADGKTLHLWSSTDASTWHESELPEVSSVSDYFRSWAQAIGGSDDVTVVAAASSPDIGTLLRDVLPADLNDKDGDPPLNIGWSGPPLVFNVHGPLGLTVFSATPEDLGLPEAEGQALLEGAGLDATVVWTSIDGRAWIPVDVGVEYVTNIFEVGGDLIVGGYGAVGYETWTSPDGFDWERDAGVGGQEHLAPWRDGFVTAGQQIATPDIAYSEDRTTWQPLGVGAYLADEFSWQFQTLAAGEGGLAAVISGYDDTDFVAEDLQPAVIERDGYTLTVDGMGGSVALRSGDELLLSLSTYSNQVYDEVVVDFRSRSVTFLHPDSLEALVSFTFEEIEHAETESFGGQHFMNQEQLVAFTGDGSTWSVESVTEAFGEDALVERLYVTDNQVVAVVAEYPNRFSPVPTVPNVVIWTAVIP
jgi:hypothetical protein